MRRHDDSADEVSQSLRALVSGLFEKVFGFLLIFLCVGILASGSGRSVEKLADVAGPWAALVLAMVYVTAALGVLLLTERKHVRGPAGVNPGAVAGFIAGCAFLFVYLFSAVSFLLAQVGWINLGVPATSEHLLAELGDGFLWYLLEMVPGLQINESIGWEKQFTLEGGGKGWILLSFRAVIVLCLFRLATRLLETDEPAYAGTIRPSSASAPRVAESASRLTNA